MSVFEKQALLDQVSQLGQGFDYMLIDTAPGIDDNVLYLNSAAQEICVIVTPEPSSVADSYALIKVLNQRCKETRFSILCNEVKDEADGAKLFARLDAVAQKFPVRKSRSRGFNTFRSCVETVDTCPTVGCSFVSGS